MSRINFLESLDSILELTPGTLQGPEKLEDFPLWDSTAIMSFIALADSTNGTRLATRDIAACNTVEDLLRIAKVGS